jgi:hypothetical protein
MVSITRFAPDIFAVARKKIVIKLELDGFIVITEHSFDWRKQRSLVSTLLLRVQSKKGLPMACSRRSLLGVPVVQVHIHLPDLLNIGLFDRSSRL